MRSSLAARVVAVPVVVAVILLGIWVTGGLITNQFRIAMWLTAGWMALAGLACFAIAARSRTLRWPVLGAYVVTAGVAGLYLGSSQLFDKTVNEQVATVPAVMAAAPAPAAAAETEPREPRPRNVRLRSGSFEPVEHAATGTATAIELAEGGRVLTLTDLDVSNGPDLRVHLVSGPALDEGDVGDAIDLGALKGNRGNQQYELPARVDLSRHSTVVIWCRAFSVNFARAPLRM